MTIFGGSPRETGRRTPVGRIGERDLAEARRLMTAFGLAIGSDRLTRKVSAELYAAAGVADGRELMTRPQDVDIVWRWLARVARTAAEQHDDLLPAQVFALMCFWNSKIVPLLEFADVLELCLPPTPERIRVRIAAHALPALRALPADAEPLGTGPGRLTVRALRRGAAAEIAALPEGDPVRSSALIAMARAVLGPDATVDAHARRDAALRFVAAMRRAGNPGVQRFPVRLPHRRKPLYGWIFPEPTRYRLGDFVRCVVLTEGQLGQAPDEIPLDEDEDEDDAPPAVDKWTARRERRRRAETDAEPPWTRPSRVYVIDRLIPFADLDPKPGPTPRGVPDDLVEILRDLALFHGVDPG